MPDVGQLAEDGSIRHMAVDGSSTREFQEALKRRKLSATSQAADTASRAVDRMGAADDPGEAEQAGPAPTNSVGDDEDRERPGDAEARMPDPAGGPIDGDFIDVVDPGFVDDGADHETSRMAQGDAPAGEESADEFDLEPKAVDVGSEATGAADFGPASQAPGGPGSSLPDRSTQCAPFKPEKAARPSRIERKAMKKAYKAGGQARATGAETANLPTDPPVAAC